MVPQIFSKTHLVSLDFLWRAHGAEFPAVSLWVEEECISYLLLRNKRLRNVVAFLSHSLDDLAQLEGLSWKVLVQSRVLSRLDGGRRPLSLTTWPVHPTALNTLPPQRGVREREGAPKALQAGLGGHRTGATQRCKHQETTGPSWRLWEEKREVEKVGWGGNHGDVRSDI